MLTQRLDWDKEISSALEEALDPAVPANLAASIRYSVLSPGKRFRPRLMEASALALGVEAGAYVPFAVALEWIHAFTLIHDDLPCMDDDDLRRGMPTNHKVFGEALALLAGDALIPAAFSWTMQSTSLTSAPTAWQAAFARLSRCSGPSGVIGGQAMEMLLTHEADSGTRPGLEALLQMHALKTGALFEAALLVPAHLAGLREESDSFEALGQFSRAFGQGFQIADDLEDAEQEQDAVAGYPVTSILHYRAPEEARQLAITSLEQACSELTRLLGASAAPLLEVSSALSSKLQEAGRNG